MFTDYDIEVLRLVIALVSAVPALPALIFVCVAVIPAIWSRSPQRRARAHHVLWLVLRRAAGK
jgi:hypothetical protein